MKITYNRPIFIGQTILDLSKTHFYNFYYNFILQKYSLQNVKLLYMDTDAYIFSLYNKDIYEIIKENIDQFDTSNYAIDNEFSIPQKNHQVLGLMKDECKGQIISEFIALRSKMYALKIYNKNKTRENEKKVCKGIKRSVVQRDICFDDYKFCMENLTTISKNQNSIRSKKHTIFTLREKKVALNPFDDKRCIVSDSHETLAWGHYSLNS